jgi:hypothetical protein
MSPIQQEASKSTSIPQEKNTLFRDKRYIDNLERISKTTHNYLCYFRESRHISLKKSRNVLQNRKKQIN